MGQTALVRELEQAGADLLRSLDTDGRLSVEAAFWLFDGLTESWRLYLAVTQVPTEGPLWAYGVVQEMIRSQPSSRLALADIAVVSPAETIVEVLRAALQTGPGVYGIRFSRNSVGGVYIEDAFIYRLTTQGALSANTGLSSASNYEAEIRDAHHFFDDHFIGAPYWEFVLHPRAYSSTRLVSTAQLKKQVSRASVRLRGWDFPHIGRGEPKTRERWVESFTDSTHHLEAFRFYLSGLFVWRRELQEERESALKGRVMFRGTIYSFAETFQFAARLADQLMSDDFSLSLRAEGLLGRALSDERDVVPASVFVANDNAFRWERMIPLDLLKSDWQAISAAAAAEFFSLFGFDSNSGEVVAFWQAKFLERGET